MQFEEPEGGYPPIPRCIFDALTIAADDLGDCIRAVEDSTNKKEATRPPSRQKVQRDKKTEARDRWIYQQCLKKTPYGAISRALKSEHPEWDHIESETGILAAAKRYARRHGKPLPPPRLEQG